MTAFSVNTSIKSSVTSSDGKLQVSTDGPLALKDALKIAQQAYAASRINSEYKSVLTSFAKRLNAKVEVAISKALGGVPIKEGRGGFYPDFYIKDEEGNIQFEEQKLVAVKERNSRLFRGKPISLAGGGGIRLTRGESKLLTGFTNDPKVRPTFETVNTTRFVNDLSKAKDNPKQLVNILSGRGKAATALRTTLNIKANSINIPVEFQGMFQNRTIKFDWKTIKAGILNGTIKADVNETANGVSLNIYFSSKLINKALNDAEKVIITELKGDFGEKILQAVAEMVSLPSNKTSGDIKKFLEDLGFNHFAQYVVGSVIIARGKVVSTKREPKKQAKTQQFVSSIQWSALVQRRLNETMRHTGLPRPPFLVNRSGRFRESVEVIPNYRNKMLKYTFNPLYRSLEAYGYNPDLQVKNAIREVAQELYSYKFNIVRG